MIDKVVAEGSHDADTHVRGFRVLPDGPVVWMRDIVRGEAPEHPLRIGSARYSDVGIFDNPDVAATHCFFLWSPERLEVRDFAKGKVTLFNGLAVDGFVQLCAGDVLSIGSKRQLTHVMAFHESPDESPKLLARTFPEYVLKAQDYLGDNERRVARTIVLDRKTYKRKLAKFSAASAVLCGVLAGAAWVSSTSSTDGASVTPASGDGASAQPASIVPAAASVPKQEASTEQTVSPVAKPPEASTERSVVAKTPERNDQKARKHKPRKKKRARKRKPKSKVTNSDTTNELAPRALGISYHSPIGARGVSARDVERKNESNR